MEFNEIISVKHYIIHKLSGADLNSRTIINICDQLFFHIHNIIIDAP